MSVTFEDSALYHPKKVIEEALKHITVEQLLDSFRPAKCCRKSVLNEKPRSTMPYAASLQSLPLLLKDLDSIIRKIQSNVPAIVKAQTLYEHHINFQKNIMSSCKKDTVTTSISYSQVYQVYFFEIFKRDEDDKSKEQSSSSRSNSNNTFNDLRILDFIKRIYTSEPLHEKVNKKYNAEYSRRHIKTGKKAKRKHQEKKECWEKRSIHPLHNKYKKMERKSFYSSVESYLTSKSQFVSRPSTSQVSAKMAKNHHSSMYSFLLIPKSKMNSCSSSNDLSISYAPSINSLPNDGATLSSASMPLLSLDAEGDEFCLSPRNFAKTLEAVYELDKNGNMRRKPTSDENSALPVIQHFPLPSVEIQSSANNAGNLSTIYEADEKNTIKENNTSVRKKSSHSVSPRSSTSPKSSNTTRNIKPSRIPVSVHSSTSKIFAIPKNNPKTNEYEKVRRLCLPSGLCPAYFFKALEKTTVKLVDASTSTSNIPNEVIAKVHPKLSSVKSSQIKAEPTANRRSAQPSSEVANMLELPITFDIVKPANKKPCSLIEERKVLSYDITPDTKKLDVSAGDVKCYRSENVCMWPLLQSKYEVTNRAFYVSVHGSHFHIAGISEKGKLGNFTSQVQVLQQYPGPGQNKQQNNTKKKNLSVENFVIGYIGNNVTNTKGALKKPYVFNKYSLKNKGKFINICPEVINIKVAKDIKSTKLKHKIFKDGDKPGYVAALSTPCHCPDITIFLPCCCGKSENCSPSLVREAQQYAMVPIAKNEKRK